jgi:hypothetical protein
MDSPYSEKVDSSARCADQKARRDVDCWRSLFHEVLAGNCFMEEADEKVCRNWASRMAVSEDACKKVFARLTKEKKDGNSKQAKASTSTAQSRARVKNVSVAVVQSLGLDADGSDIGDELDEPDPSPTISV